MKQHFFVVTALTIIASLAVGCGSDADIATTDSSLGDSGDAPGDSVGDLDDDAVVFVWTETGGCAMAGPNCARYEVTTNGDVTTYREGDDEPAVNGTIDSEIVAAWLAAVDATDVESMVDQLDQGELTAAFDGIDTTVAAPHRDIEVSSVDYEFDTEFDFFQAAQDLMVAAQNAAPLELQMRE